MEKAPEGLDSYKVYLDMSRQDVRLDWSESAVRADEYQVSVYGTELLYQETLDREERKLPFPIRRIPASFRFPFPESRTICGRHLW